MPMPEMRCNTCGVVKPLEAFAIDVRKLSGHRGRCKACENAGQKIRHYAKRAAMLAAAALEPEPEPIRIVRLPRRRYDRCPKCGSRGVLREESGEHWCLCGWSEPLYRAVQSAQYAMA